MEERINCELLWEALKFASDFESFLSFWRLELLKSYFWDSWELISSRLLLWLPSIFCSDPLDPNIFWLWSFMVKLKVVPLPIPSDSTLTVPPDRSTIYLTIVNPKPIPSLLISAVRYNLPKRVKSFGKSYYAMPEPVSRTCTNKYFSSSSTPGFREAIISMNPCFVNFIALRMRLIKTYFNRRSSPIKRGTRLEQELRSSRSSLSPYKSILSVTCES